MMAVENLKNATDYSFEYCEDGFPKNYSYLVIERQKGKIELRIREIVDEESAREWLNKLNHTDSTNWRVLRTYPRERFLKSVMFKQDMRCQHNTDKRYISGQKRTKNTDCSVTMSIMVKRTNIRYSKAKDNDPLLKEWPCIIKIIGEHNHPLFNTSNLSSDVMMNEETQQKLCEYFWIGHSPETAFHMLSNQLLLDHPTVSEHDHQLLPHLSDCRRLYHSKFKQQFGERSAEQLTEDLKSLTDSKAALLRVTDDGQHVIFYCSPIMRRVHELVFQSSQVMFVDAYGGNVDSHKRKLYLFSAMTVAGCLPLGMIIAETDSKDLFNAALATFLEECLPAGKFHSNGYPQVVITNNNFLENSALLNHFPNSRHLICHVSVLRDTWDWLSDITQDISKTNRPEMMWSLKVLMHSQSETQFNDNYEELMSSVMLDNYPSFRNYLMELCQRKHQWAFCFREGLPAIEYGMNENVDAIEAHLLREVMETRIMSFNLLQLFDFITTIYENRILRKLQAISNNEVELKFTSVVESIPSDHVGKHRDPDIFLIKNGNDKRWKVDLNRFTCTCSVGNVVENCNHIKAVMARERTFQCTASENTDHTPFLIILMRVATGMVVDSTHWLYSVKQNNQPEKLQSEPTSQSRISDSEVSDSREDNDVNQEELLTDLGVFVDRIVSGLKKSPKVFYPALKAMLGNVKTNTKTEKDLLAAMHCFGKSHLESNETGQISSFFVNVQPISIVSCPTTQSSSFISGQSNEVSLKINDHDYAMLSRVSAKEENFVYDFDDSNHSDNLDNVKCLASSSDLDLLE